jgi:excinuclease ABC subunit B
LQSRPQRPETLALDELLSHITGMERDMKKAAKDLDFERAAQLRDEIANLRKFLPDAQWRK